MRQFIRSQGFRFKDIDCHARRIAIKKGLRLPLRPVARLGSMISIFPIPIEICAGSNAHSGSPSTHHSFCGLSSKRPVLKHTKRVLTSRSFPTLVFGLKNPKTQVRLALEAVCKSDESRTHDIHVSFVRDIIKPFGGSFEIEKLALRMVRRPCVPQGAGR